MIYAKIKAKCIKYLNTESEFDFIMKIVSEMKSNYFKNIKITKSYNFGKIICIISMSNLHFLQNVNKNI